MKKSATIIFTFFIFSRSSSNNQDLTSLEWMLGQWKSQTGEEIIVEYWHKTADTLFHGETWFIDAGDTIASEQLKIVARGNDIIYVAAPSGQPVTEFKLAQLKNNEALFENPGHDFPQKIVYKRISSDSLYARIEGVIDGREQSMDFNWVLVGN